MKLCLCLIFDHTIVNTSTFINIVIGQIVSLIRYCLHTGLREQSENTSTFPVTYLPGDRFPRSGTFTYNHRTLQPNSGSSQSTRAIIYTAVRNHKRSRWALLDPHTLPMETTYGQILFFLYFFQISGTPFDTHNGAGLIWNIFRTSYIQSPNYRTVWQTFRVFRHLDFRVWSDQ